MLFAGKNSKRFVLGYDLGDEVSQISFLASDSDMPETLSILAGAELYNIPTVLCKRHDVNQWFYGKEAVKHISEDDGVAVTNLVTLAREGQMVDVDGMEYDPIALLTLFVKRTLSLLSMEMSINLVDAIMVTTKNLDNRMVKVLNLVMSGLDLKDVKVYIDSPMANAATEVFKKNAQVFDEATKDYISKGDNPLEFENLKFTQSTEESQWLNIDKEPKVIISASGMCEAGRIRHHLKHNLWDARNSVIFVGYQGEGTLGRALIEGAKDVTLFGEDVHVQAEIYNLEGFSGHADQNGLLSWISGFEKPPKQVFLVHGEEEAKLTFAALVKEKLGYEPIVVMGNSEYEIDMNDVSVVNMEEAKKTAAEDEEVQKVRNKIAGIHMDLESILYNANMAMQSELSEEKLVKINNIVQELEKATINLGSAVNAREDNVEKASPEEPEEKPAE